MDADLGTRLQRLERRQRWLLGGVLALGCLCAAQAAGWFPRSGADLGEFREVRADRIVVGRQPGWRMTLKPRSLVVREGDEYRDSPSLWLHTDDGLMLGGDRGNTWIRPGEFELTGKGGGLLELKTIGRDGAEPHITFLSQGAQTDIGAGFTAVSGKAGVTSIDGRETVGMRVIDRATGEVRPAPR